ncbi:hypothetical protein [Krasilnikoviella flava]|uniref:PAP2 superfamily protein n=1 Tax=Krasilnikoviella flava TaxID=526729 RepID=A0A1T5IE81_9MICO|nr:hypothetical protein [Krasilnikoviella flava]SKC37358.1 hypothetical protein SAMN04324258_0394 [Krasilnikoviella flava]
MSRPETSRRHHAVRAAALAVGFVVLYVAGVVAPWGQRVDELAFNVLTGAGAPLRHVAGVAREVLVLGLGVVVAVLAVRALRDRRWPALAASLALAAAAALAFVLRGAVLPRPVHDVLLGYPYNTFPSTHVAATAALALVLVALWPSRGSVGPVVVREAALAAVVLACVVNVVTFAHRPFDVLGSLLLVGAVASAVAAVSPGALSPAVDGKFTPVAALRPRRPA